MGGGGMRLPHATATWGWCDFVEERALQVAAGAGQGFGRRVP